MRSTVGQNQQHQNQSQGVVSARVTAHQASGSSGNMHRRLVPTSSGKTLQRSPAAEQPNRIRQSTAAGARNARVVSSQVPPAVAAQSPSALNSQGFASRSRQSGDTEENGNARQIYHKRGPVVYGSASGTTRLVLKSSGSLKKFRPRLARCFGQTNSGSTEDMNQLLRLHSDQVAHLGVNAELKDASHTPTMLDSRNFKQVFDVYGAKSGRAGRQPSHLDSQRRATENRDASESANSHLPKSLGSTDRSARRLTGAQFRNVRLRQGHNQQQRGVAEPPLNQETLPKQASQNEFDAQSRPADTDRDTRPAPAGTPSGATGQGSIPQITSREQYQSRTEQPLLRIVKQPEQRFRRRLVAIAQAQQDKIKTLTGSQQKTKQIMTQSSSQLTGTNVGGQISNQNKAAQKFQYLSKSEERAGHAMQPAGSSEHLKMVGAINIQSTRNNNNEYNFATQGKVDGSRFHTGMPGEFQIKLATQAASQGSARRMAPNADQSQVDNVASARGGAKDELMKQGLNSVRTMAGASNGGVNIRELTGSHAQRASDSLNGGSKLHQKMSPRMHLQQITEANTRPMPEGSYGTQPKSAHNATLNVGNALKQIHMQQPQTVKNANGQSQQISIRRLPPQQQHSNPSSKMALQQNGARRMAEASLESAANAAVPTGLLLQQHSSAGSLQKYGGSFDRERSESGEQRVKLSMPSQNYNRRRQQLQQVDSNSSAADGMQFKILKPLANQGGVPSSNTMDAQMLSQELKYASLQTTPGQQQIMLAQQKKVQTNSNQAQLAQAAQRAKAQYNAAAQGANSQRFSTAISKVSSSRKPSRGQLMNQQGNVPTSGSNKTKIKLTQLNKIVFSTPGLLSNDASQGNLNVAAQQNAQQPATVIFHPHPLNDKQHGQGYGNGAMTAAIAQKISAAQQTPQIAQQQQDMLFTTERPHSQKQVAVSSINNRNSRKNFRPVAKKAQVGSQGRERQPAPVGHGSLMLRHRSGSGEGTERRHNQMTGPTQPVSAVLGAVLSGKAHRNPQFEVPQLVQVQTDASASTSRERAAGLMNSNNISGVGSSGQGLQLNLNLNEAAAKENYQASQGAYMTVKDQQPKDPRSSGLGKSKKIKTQYQSTPGNSSGSAQNPQQQMQRTQQLVLKYNQQQQPVGPLFQQQPSTKNSSLIKVNPGMPQGQTRTLPTSSRYNQKISFQNTQPLQGLGLTAQQVQQEGIMSQRMQQSQQATGQKRRVGKSNERGADTVVHQGPQLKTGSNSQQKLSSLALNFNTSSQPSGMPMQQKNGSQTNFMASQTLDLGALGNLNDLSSLNENATAAAGLSSFSAIENLLIGEDASQLSNKNSGAMGTNMNMYNSQDALPMALGPKDKLPSKLSYVTSQAQSARASQVLQTGPPPVTGSGRLVKGSGTGGGSKLGSKRASRLQLNVNSSSNYNPTGGNQLSQLPQQPVTNPSTTKWAQQKDRPPITDGVLNSLTGTFDGQKKQMAQTQRIQLHGINQVGPKTNATLQKVLGSHTSSQQNLKTAGAIKNIADLQETSQGQQTANQTVYGGGTIGTTGKKEDQLQKTTIGSAPEADFGVSAQADSMIDLKNAVAVIEEHQRPMQVDEAENPADEEDNQVEEDAADTYNDSKALSKEQQQADTQTQRLQKSSAVLNLAQPALKGKSGESGTKTAGQQRTTMDTNSQRKQQTTQSDSQQRTNFNTSMQNIPRGLINTAFSLSSVASRGEEHTTPRPALPTTPQNILKFYIHELTDYEKGEVLDYETIYFLGKSKDKKVDKNYSGDATTNPGAKPKADKQSPSNADDKKQGATEESKEKKDDQIFNYGYDDDKGDYKVVIGDHIGYRYEIVEFLGKGSFGTALGCIDHKEKREVAVKIVKNKKKYYYQASVELKILQYLRQHDHEDIMNVIHIEDYVVFRKHLCMSFERLSMNLFEFLKINDFNGFDHNLIRRFAIQLLYALKYLKQLEIIHCDLKPENILLKEENKSGIKIIDFGSSTFIDEKVYTYIQSRFYRAPEIMLGIPYTTAIDMWSLGCIMAELYIGYPLFPGESENDQMSRIMEMRDVPPAPVLKVSERKMKFFTQNKTNGKLDPVMLKNSRGKLRKPNGKPLDYVIGDEDEDFNDFVARCLDWNPETRLTPDEALKHVWVLKGLPPQVLIHHQKMHNIQTPELPIIVKEARDEFINEQREQEMLMLRQQQAQNQSRDSRSTRGGVGPREISQNPNTIQRPAIQLKTPRQAGMVVNTLNLGNKSTKKSESEYQSQVPALGENLTMRGQSKPIGSQNQSNQASLQQSTLGSARKKFLIKK